MPSGWTVGKLLVLSTLAVVFLVTLFLLLSRTNVDGVVRTIENAPHSIPVRHERGSRTP